MVHELGSHTPLYAAGVDGKRDMRQCSQSDEGSCSGNASVPDLSRLQSPATVHYASKSAFDSVDA